MMLSMGKKILHKIKDGVEYKYCKICDQWHFLYNFNKKSASWDNLETKCKTCAQNKSTTFKQNNPTYNKDYYSSNHLKELIRCTIKRLKNPEYIKNYQKNNRGKINAIAAKRRATPLQATPKWLTEEHWAQIYKIYKNCPEGYKVDHIIPIKGKNFCGLHVPWNLQYLTKSDNRKKKNNLEVKNETSHST